MKYSLIAFLAVAFAGFSVVNAEDPVRITTYNIRYLNNNDGDDHWKFRVDAVSDVVKAADIVGLQEATRPQIDQIAERTDGYQWYGEGRDDGKDRGEFSPIFWKSDKFELLDKGTFWLGPDPTAIGKPAWGANLPRICSWVVLKPVVLSPSEGNEPSGDTKSSGSDDPILVFNTHFDHQSSEARLNSAGLIRKQAAEISKQFDQRRAVILMGDFNCQPDSEPVARLTSQSEPGMTFTDSMTLSNVKPSGPTGTWNGFQKIAEGRRIDFVFVGDPNTKIMQHQTLDPKTADGRFASDHLPVSIVLQ